MIALIQLLRTKLLASQSCIRNTAKSPGVSTTTLRFCGWPEKSIGMHSENRFASYSIPHRTRWTILVTRLTLRVSSIAIISLNFFTFTEAGWGQTETNFTSAKKLKITIKGRNIDECKKTYGGSGRIVVDSQVSRSVWSLKIHVAISICFSYVLVEDLRVSKVASSIYEWILCSSTLQERSRGEVLFKTIVYSNFHHIKIADMVQQQRWLRFVLTNSIESSNYLQHLMQHSIGGPLMLYHQESDVPYWALEGIVSYGDEVCNERKVPGVYTRVSKYLDWISSNLRSWTFRSLQYSMELKEIKFWKMLHKISKYQTLRFLNSNQLSWFILRWLMLKPFLPTLFA